VVFKYLLTKWIVLAMEDVLPPHPFGSQVKPTYSAKE
jgi:hypothetical protein